MIKVVCISDTHNQLRHVEIPDGDILIHAGDHTSTGNIAQISKAMQILGDKGKKFKHVIAINGNHDWLGVEHPMIMRQICADNNIIYLEHEPVVIEGIKFFGSPFTPEFNGWAYNVPRNKLAKKWAQIPDDTNVLITHGPAYEILDKCPDGSLVGCEAMLKRIKDLPNLSHHIFGHIHYSHGTKVVNNVTHINASLCTEDYKPTNKPIVFEI
jgi:Icc-related predicted phosphoesterase